MGTESRTPAKGLKFGDLLVHLKMLSETDLADALKVAPQFGLPIGRTLVLSGLITDEELQLVVELQPLIASESINIEQARAAVKALRTDKLTPTKALSQIGVTSSTEKATIGALLLEAGVINQAQLEQAKTVSYSTGMRFGRVLLLNGFINHQILTRALEIQHMVRERRISLEQGVMMLNTALSKQAGMPLKLEAHSMAPAPANKQVRFGEFIILCGLATESEILNALEISMEKGQTLGEAIVGLGLISSRIYDQAQDLYGDVTAGVRTLKDATEEIHKLVFGVAAAASEQHIPLLGELLKMTGFVTDSDITEAVELSNKYPSLIGKMLVISGAIDEATLISSLRCQYLLKHGLISVEDAVRTLQFAREQQISLDDALEELGLRKQAHSNIME
ncbi:MAG: hypothetical protein IT342_01485 [Candidatus Melainabacteria bacterium]|nr:hypothetical protein [Candidatus Melainabacteria bacterium]